MATGRPTILGWRVHEWLWRGSFDEPDKRTGQVKTIYESTNSAEVGQLLNTYNVEYIFVGSLEREQYPELREDKFKELATPVFSSRETTVWKVRQN